MSRTLILAGITALSLALLAPDVRRAILESAGISGEANGLLMAAPAVLPTERMATEPVNAPSEAILTSVETALARLGPYVAARSHPEALRAAFQAYHTYKADHPEQVRKPYLYFVDFGLDSRTPRGYVFDMEQVRLVEGPFTVAHGRGSVQGGSIIPTRFSNVRGSNATSLGLYLAQETYGFRGRSDGRAYQSIGLRLQGLSGPFNSAARARGIVVHGAPYVTPQNAGRSEGCPAMPQALADELLPRLANGGLVFHFSPHDVRWLEGDPWVNRWGLRLASID